MFTCCVVMLAWMELSFSVDLLARANFTCYLI